MQEAEAQALHSSGAEYATPLYLNRAQPDKWRLLLGSLEETLFPTRRAFLASPSALARYGAGRSWDPEIREIPQSPVASTRFQIVVVQKGVGRAGREQALRLRHLCVGLLLCHVQPRTQKPNQGFDQLEACCPQLLHRVPPQKTTFMQIPACSGRIGFECWRSWMGEPNFRRRHKNARHTLLFASSQWTYPDSLCLSGYCKLLLMLLRLVRSRPQRSRKLQGLGVCGLRAELTGLHSSSFSEFAMWSVVRGCRKRGGNQESSEVAAPRPRKFRPLRSPRTIL